ncbi:MAG: hypothetical protein ACREB2_14060 [Pseudolabrys sp.]
MTSEAASEQIKRELDEALGTMRSELDRVELLAAALSVFSHPIPDYEPRFHHLNRVALSAQELGKAAGRRS